DLLAETGVFPSKGEARKMMQQGGLSMNKQKITDIGLTLNSSYLMNHKYLLIQKGKKNYNLIIAE
ncbi:MAG: tyrosine--tRNA ligase, partial [Chitinophagaceae bacterium]|nr:tyrosine--tRNA ligase [Chitinophagaceae bacterium]